MHLRGQGFSTQSHPVVEVLDVFHQVAGGFGGVCGEGGSPIHLWDVVTAPARRSKGGGSPMACEGNAEANEGIVCPGDGLSTVKLLKEDKFWSRRCSAA